MVCRFMMCESFEVMASEPLVGMMPAAFVKRAWALTNASRSSWSGRTWGEALEPAFTVRLAPQC